VDDELHDEPHRHHASGARASDDAPDGAPDDTSDAVDEPRATPLPPVHRFRGTAIGTVLSAALTGLGDALEPSKKEDPAIVIEHDGGPEPFTEPIVLRLDPDDPRDSIVLVRRHLMPRHDDGPAEPRD
jgi:hypothetical protein